MTDASRFQWDSGDYANHSRVQRPWAREWISHLDLKGAVSLLDAGCDDGNVTAEMASHLEAGGVLGIDNSEAMIKRARHPFPSRTHPNLRFRTVDAGRIAFSRAFGIVFSNAVRHWVRFGDPSHSGATACSVGPRHDLQSPDPDRGD
jgi:trans-aconitate methyltransferase